MRDKVTYPCADGVCSSYLKSSLNVRIFSSCPKDPQILVFTSHIQFFHHGNTDNWFPTYHGSSISSIGRSLLLCCNHRPISSALSTKKKKRGGGRADDSQRAHTRTHTQQSSCFWRDTRRSLLSASLSALTGR